MDLIQLYFSQSKCHIQFDAIKTETATVCTIFRIVDRSLQLNEQEVFSMSHLISDQHPLHMTTVVLNVVLFYLHPKHSLIFIHQIKFGVCSAVYIWG